MGLNDIFSAEPPLASHQTIQCLKGEFPELVSRNANSGQ